MKVWKYYRIPEDDSVKKDYELYAVTNQKSFAERFEKERDMNLFIKADVIDIEKEEYADFANKNRSAVLEFHALDTKEIKDNGCFGVGVIDILITNGEYMEANKDEVDNLLFSEDLFDLIPHYGIFNKKILKSLKLLEFVPYYKLMRNNPYMDEVYDDYTAPDIQFDEFAIFIRIFSRLFK